MTHQLVSTSSSPGSRRCAKRLSKPSVATGPERVSPETNVASAEAIAGELFGIHGRPQSLPSERDQNFLVTDGAGEKFVLKIANALESRAFLEAQNAVLEHVGRRVSLCQSPVTSEIVTIDDRYFARLVGY